MSYLYKYNTPAFRPLPRGRHKLDPKELRATRRARLLRAVKDLVGEKGYAATTVPEVVARARVSRNAFYDFFADKAGCFLALCEEEAKELQRIVASHVSAEDWRTSLAHGIRAYLRWWQERPELSRAYFIEMPTVGARAVAVREGTYEPFEKIFAALSAWIQKLDPTAKRISKRIPRMLTVAITEIVADEIRADRLESLSDLEDDLLLLIERLLYVTDAARAGSPR